MSSGFFDCPYARLPPCKLVLWKLALWKLALWKLALWKPALWKPALWKPALWKPALWITVETSIRRGRLNGRPGMGCWFTPPGPWALPVPGRVALPKIDVLETLRFAR